MQEAERQWDINTFSLDSFETPVKSVSNFKGVLPEITLPVGIKKHVEAFAHAYGLACREVVFSDALTYVCWVLRTHAAAVCISKRIVLK